MTADRDDLAAILAKHRWEWEPIGPIYKCICGEEVYADVHRNDMEAHRASMVLESDWLRGVRAKELRDAGDDYPDRSDYPAQWLRDRADRVDAEDTDNTTDRT